MITHIHQALQNAQSALKQLQDNHELLESVSLFSERLAQTFKEGKKVMIFGNGGSACDAAHFAQEWTGQFRKPRPAMPVLTFGDVGHLTCVANDYGFEHIFTKGVSAFCQAGDIVMGISTSGNSSNVIHALDEAKQRKAITCALIGRDGGKMKNRYDVEWLLSGETTDRIQELHMLLLHILIETTERRLFPDNYK